MAKFVTLPNHNNVPLAINVEQIAYAASWRDDNCTIYFAAAKADAALQVVVNMPLADVLVAIKAA